MIPQRMLITALFAASVLCLVAGWAWADKYKTPSGEAQDQMTLRHKDTFKTFKRGPVEFSHRAHHEDYKLKCQQCHHEFDGGKNIWKEGDPATKCAECHMTPLKPEGKMPSLHQAFHGTCRNCHKAAQAGPLTCGECHQ